MPLDALAALMPVMREISFAYGVGFRTFVLPARWGEPAETTTKITTVLHGGRGQVHWNAKHEVKKYRYPLCLFLADTVRTNAAAYGG